MRPLNSIIINDVMTTLPAMTIDTRQQVVPRDLLKDIGAREVLPQKTCSSIMKPEDGVPYQPVETEN